MSRFMLTDLERLEMRNLARVGAAQNVTPAVKVYDDQSLEFGTLLNAKREAACLPECYKGTVTGRTSSSAPEAQELPGLTWFGKAGDRPPEDEAKFKGQDHYGSWKHLGRRLSKRANTVAALLPGLMEELGADHIVVKGTSGTWMAAALLMLLPDLQVMELHKEGLDRHGREIEGSYDREFRRGLIVDDMIASGRTIDGIIRQTPCKVVGVLMHEGAESGIRLQRHAGWCNRFGCDVWGIQ